MPNIDDAEQRKQTLRPTPSIKIRLLWWFGIYFAAQLPLMMLAPFFLTFPRGLISPFLAQIWPNRPTDGTYTPWDFVNGPANLVSYLIYGVLFGLVFLMPSSRAFRSLMIVLTVVVLLNLGGCALGLHDQYGGNIPAEIDRNAASAK